MVSAALRAVGNIVTGDDIQTQVMFHELSPSLTKFSFSGDHQLWSSALLAPAPLSSQGVDKERGRR